MNTQIMDEIYYKYKKSLTKSRLHKNKLISVLQSNKMILGLNAPYSEINLDTMIIPIGGTDIVCFQIFENENVLNNYKQINEMDSSFNFHEIDTNIFYMTLQELYLKGVTGVLLNCEMDGAYKTLYYPILELIKYEKTSAVIDNLYTKEKQDIIRILNRVKNTNSPFSYIYRRDLTAHEVSFYIVKYQIFEDKKGACIKLFTTEEEADEYCKANQLELNGELMNTKIHNGALFNSLYHSVEKAKFVEIYDKDTSYKIPTLELLELVSGVGFEQINLGGDF